MGGEGGQEEAMGARVGRASAAASYPWVGVPSATRGEWVETVAAGPVGAVVVSSPAPSLANGHSVGAGTGDPALTDEPPPALAEASLEPVAAATAESGVAATTGGSSETAVDSGLPGARAWTGDSALTDEPPPMLAEASLAVSLRGHTIANTQRRRQTCRPAAARCQSKPDAETEQCRRPTWSQGPVTAAGGALRCA